jgi:hypothetical protein
LQNLSQQYAPPRRPVRCTSLTGKDVVRSSRSALATYLFLLSPCDVSVKALQRTSIVQLIVIFQPNAAVGVPAKSHFREFLPG